MCTRKKHDCHLSQHNEKRMSEEKDHTPELTMHGNAITSGFDALDKLVGGKNLYEINKALACDTILQFD
jgi:hypothetical protein